MVPVSDDLTTNTSWNAKMANLKVFSNEMQQIPDFTSTKTLKQFQVSFRDLPQA